MNNQTSIPETISKTVKMTYKNLDSEFFYKQIWFTSAEAADYLRVSQANLRVMIYRGILRPYKLNNRNRFKREELDELIESSIKRSQQ